MEPRQARRAGARVADPEDGVEVAEPADALLEVGLLHRDRPELRPPLGELHPHRLEERLGALRLPGEALRELLLELLEERPAPGDEAGLRQRRPRVEVAAGFRHALADGPEAVSDLEADVPEELEHLLREGADVVGSLPGVEEQEVDVGGRGELGPAIAAERDDGDLLEIVVVEGRGLRGDEPADPRDDDVDLVAPDRRDLKARGPGPMAHPETLRLQPQKALEAVDLGPAARTEDVRGEAFVRVLLDALGDRRGHAAPSRACARRRRAPRSPGDTHRPCPPPPVGPEGRESFPVKDFRSGRPGVTVCRVGYEIGVYIGNSYERVGMAA